MKSGGGTDPLIPQQPALSKVLKSERWGLNVDKNLIVTMGFFFYAFHGE